MPKFVIRITKEAEFEVEAEDFEAAYQEAAAIEGDGAAEFDMTISVIDENDVVEHF